MADSQNQQLNTDRIRDLLSPYLDGEVTQAERALVEQALAASVELQRELETLRRMVALVAAMPPVAAPRPFTLTAADAKGVAPAWKGFFGWSIWVKSVAGLAAALLCVVAAAGIFLTMQRGGANSPQAAEVANAPAAARQEAAPAESAAREEPAPTESGMEDTVGEAAAVVPATPTAVASPATAMAESSADEAAKPVAPAGEAMTTEGEAHQADQEMQSQEAPSAGAIVSTTLPPPEATASPTSQPLLLSAPAQESAQEGTGAGSEADTSQKAVESATPATEQAEVSTTETTRKEVAVENAQVPEQPPAVESPELEPVSPAATPTATLPPEPNAPAVAQLTPTVPVTLTPTASSTPAPESSAPGTTDGWFGAGVAIIGLVIIAGLIIWLVSRSQNRAP